MSDNVRLQNLRDFTVQIRDATSDAIVGTGIVVSMDGRIVTCAHVVRATNVGMSGAAVVDVERNPVVGIVSETGFPDLSTQDGHTAWAVNGRVLTFDPLHLPVRDAPLPKGAAPQPKTDIDAARAAVAPNL